ncbi:MAG: type I-U CRISPR-associated RAMP protein Csb1/Cas7u [Candidatus Thermoplasmatota archaeon]|nr:type I-U CRISPR-associated RAMP protein Csb1/Cas7u [Candidatus Thermoplasmatota archaeon]
MNEEIKKEFEKLVSAPRLLIEAELVPRQGDRFQPTGFPEIGAAVYERPDGKRMILVESAQSMANGLETVCINDTGTRIDIIEELKGIPYIIAELEDKKTKKTITATSSLVEAHRINSPFIITDKDFKNKFSTMAEYSEGKQVDWEKVAKAMFYYDVNSLLHGTFLSNLGDGRVKVPRTLTGFIEAEDIKGVFLGGTKNSLIDPTGTIRAESFNKNVYGNVPFHRIEYTATKIKAYYNIDLALIRGYNLNSSAKTLLIALSLYKIIKFLNTKLRLRSSCDLKLKDKITVTEPSDFKLLGEEQLISILKETIENCKSEHLFADPPITKIHTTTVKVDKKHKDDDNMAEQDSGSSPY